MHFQSPTTGGCETCHKLPHSKCLPIRNITMARERLSELEHTIVENDRMEYENENINTTLTTMSMIVDCC